MKRMDLSENAALREQGWRVFRSASRDHLVPATSSGAALQRIKIAEALPVGGVFEGVAIPDEERVVRSSARADVARRAEDVVVSGLSQTQTMSFDVRNRLFNPIGLIDEETEIAIAPFDGFLTEITFSTVGVGAAFLTAVRTTDGFTFATSVSEFSAAPPAIDRSPDFFSPFEFSDAAAGGRRSPGRSNIPVYAGASIILVMRQDGAAAPDVNRIIGLVTFQSASGVRRVGPLASVGAFRNLQETSRVVTREINANATRLAIEQERTRRVQLEQAGLTERAKLAVDAQRPAGGFLGNPFQELLLSPQAARQLASRALTPPPPPRVRPAPPAPLEGSGKTFVSAWNPSFGSIGYLVPDPPRGGRVNVFDQTYTIWDISGKNVGQGLIIPIASDGDIPPGARISRNLGVEASEGLAVSVFVPGQGFQPG